jgi:hypothetical protein
LVETGFEACYSKLVANLTLVGTGHYYETLAMTRK